MKKTTTHDGNFESLITVPFRYDTNSNQEITNWHCSKKCLHSLNLCRNTKVEMITHIPLYRKENWGPGRLRNSTIIIPTPTSIINKHHHIIAKYYILEFINVLSYFNKLLLSHTNWDHCFLINHFNWVSKVLNNLNIIKCECFAASITRPLCIDLLILLLISYICI